MQNLKVVSFSCQSIVGKSLEVLEYFEDNNIDIAICQETWMKRSDKHIVNEAQEYGYKFIKMGFGQN